MTKFRKNLTKIGRSMSDRILPDRGKFKIRLTIKEKIEEIKLTLNNIFYFPNSPSNFISLGLLNNSRIYQNNKD